MKLSGVFLLVGIKDGESVEYMELVTAPSTISVSQFNVQKTPLSIELVHRVGASTTPKEGFVQVYAKSGDVTIAGTEHSLGVCSRTSYTIAADNMKLAAATSIVVEAFNNAQKEVLLASIEVPINVYGNVDAVYRDFKWSNPPVWTNLPAGTKFRNGDYFVIEKNGQSNIYMWACRVEGITTKAPFDPTISPEELGYWEHVTEKTLFATKMLLAKSALLGSAVFNGDWTISQHGVSMGTNPDTGQPYDYHDFDAAMSKFKPNLSIDWLNGKVFASEMKIAGNSEFKGRLNGVTGSFYQLSCLNKEDKECGRIEFYQKDSITIGNAHLYHNGVLPDNMPLRFYASNIWCRGNFGAASRCYAEVYNNQIFYYVDGLGKPPVQQTLQTRLGTSSDVYPTYQIDMHGTENTAILGNSTKGRGGFPVDVLVFSGQRNYYELEMQASQRAMIINANMNETIYVYSHGQAVSWLGGEMAEVVRISKKSASPAENEKQPGAYLYVGAFRKNQL